MIFKKSPGIPLEGQTQIIGRRFLLAGHKGTSYPTQCSCPIHTPQPTSYASTPPQGPHKLALEHGPFHWHNKGLGCILTLTLRPFLYHPMDLSTSENCPELLFVHSLISWDPSIRDPRVRFGDAPVGRVAIWSMTVGDEGRVELIIFAVEAWLLWWKEAYNLCNL